jgi:membrane protein required for colicin V production
MNALDIVIGVVLVFSLVRGIFRGLIEELSSIIGVAGGLYGAVTYYPDASRLLGRWISNTHYASILGFLLIFTLVVILVGILGVIIKYLMNIASLGWSDRVLGALVGGLKGVLIISVLLLSLTAFLPKGTPVLKDSLLAPHATKISETLAMVVSDDLKSKFDANVKALKTSWKKSP